MTLCFPFWSQPRFWIIACQHFMISFSGIFSFLLTFSKYWIIEKLFAINTRKLLLFTRMLFCIVANQFVIFKSKLNDLVYSKSFEFPTAIFGLQIYQHIWAPHLIKHEFITMLMRINSMFLLWNCVVQQTTVYIAKHVTVAFFCFYHLFHYWDLYISNYQYY